MIFCLNGDFMKKICENCGKEFESSSLKQKLCSPECRILKRNERQRRRIENLRESSRENYKILKNFYKHFAKARFKDYKIESAWKCFGNGKITYEQLCRIEGRYIETAGFLGDY